jgi:hypothetical protein
MFSAEVTVISAGWFSTATKVILVPSVMIAKRYRTDVYQFHTD